ncbi:hypothetical protein [Moorena sp. SIO3I8]|nr:hypothetical protein [Moorena sp. SIO3I8]NEO08747.1 hypothetical protein [Moorena sp. SIO3I8]
MEDLSKLIDESIEERNKLIKQGGTHGTNGSLLRRRVKPRPKAKNPD